MGFSKLIEEIENELQGKYLGGAIAYIDDNLDNAWSKAMDRFDQALSNTLRTKNHEAARLEGEIYRQTILQLIEAYKHKKRNEDVLGFLEGL